MSGSFLISQVKTTSIEQIGWSAEFGHFRSEVIESEPRKYVATEDPRHSVINPTPAPRFAWSTPQCKSARR